MIGDVHACDERLELVLNAFERSGVDALCCVGDIVTGPGSPDRCVELLKTHNVITVRGNHDRWLLEGVSIGEDAHTLAELSPATAEFIRNLPASVELTAATGTRVLLCHGLADNDMNPISSDDYGYALEQNEELQHLLRSRTPLLVVKGHRHRPALWKLGPLTMIDAGCLLDYTEVVGVTVDFTETTVTNLMPGGSGIRIGEPLGW